MMDVAVPANMKVGMNQDERDAPRLGTDGATGPELSSASAMSLLIDLRENAERQRNGTIPGSLHVPYPSLEESIGAGGMLHELASSTRKRLLFYCAFR